MKHYVTAPIFDNDGGYVYCSGKFIEYFDLNELKYTDYDVDVTCELCLEKLEKFEQLKEKFGCKCFCHDLKYNQEHPIGHAGRFRICCSYYSCCDFRIDKNLEKEHKQYHMENK